jgi:TfoX/Sxy family transcriptional regulator of competence genes
MEEGMVYNKDLAIRVRDQATNLAQLDEMKMFGGLGFLLHGNMACGVLGDNLIVRVGPDAYKDALSKPNVQVFDYTGRPMNGWIFVTPDGILKDDELADWVQAGVQYAQTLPPKQ